MSRPASPTSNSSPPPTGLVPLNVNKMPKPIGSLNKSRKDGRLPTNLLMRQIWLTYQFEEKEFLSEDIAIILLIHLLKFTNVEEVFKETLKKKAVEEKDEFYKEVALVWLNEMDPKVEGKLPYIQFEKLLNELDTWKGWLKEVLQQGREHRLLTIRLREEYRKKVANTRPKCSSKKKKPKKISKEEQKEHQEIDKMWDDQMLEEERDLKIEKESQRSKALSTESIHSLRSEQIKEVSEILEIRENVAEALLDKVKWNQDKLMQEYFNDPEQFLKSVGIELSSGEKKEKKEEKSDSDAKEEEEICCSICFDDLPASKVTSMDVCGHTFCNGCWKDMLETMISEGHTFDILCMQHGCNQLVPPSIVEKLVSPETKQRYTKFLSKTFVEHAQHIRWCPAPGCDNAITDPVTEGRIRVTTCLCGNRICWECEKEAHPPISCKILSKFEETAKKDEKNLGFMIDNNLDAGTLKWMQENTKQCPFCNVVVQKHNGCYCMTCKQCNQNWCWLCRESWAPTHTNHFKCTKFNAGGSQLSNKPRNKDKDTFKNRLHLERLAHYCRLYQEQTKAIKMESNPGLKEQDQKKIKALKKEFETLDVDFISEGRLQLRKCRETLKYSYAHSYFLKSSTTSHKVIEYLQQNLEITIEKLAQALDRPARLEEPEVAGAPTGVNGGTAKEAPTTTAPLAKRKNQPAAPTPTPPAPPPMPIGPVEYINPPEIRKLIKIAEQAMNGLLIQLMSDAEKVEKVTRDKVKKDKSKAASPPATTNPKPPLNNASTGNNDVPVPPAEEVQV